MANRKKSWSVKPVKRGTKIFLTVLFILWFILFLLTFEAVAKPVSGMLGRMGINISTEKLMRGAVTVLHAVTGGIFIKAGLALLTVPFLGAAMIVAGGVFMAIAVIRTWNSKQVTEDQIIKTSL